jgi:hypothetical protein
LVMGTEGIVFTVIGGLPTGQVPPIVPSPIVRITNMSSKPAP